MSDRRGILEQQLTDGELATVAALCAAVPVPASLWTELPIARSFVVLAAERLAARIRDERGCTLTMARARAAAQLDVDADTIARLRRRWRSVAYNRTKCPGNVAA